MSDEKVVRYLKELVRRVTTHMALTAGLVTFAHAPAAEAREPLVPEPSISARSMRKYSGKYILKRTRGAVLRLAQHRSHASHASHASHYSGSGGYVPPPASPAPAPVVQPPTPQPPPAHPKKTGWRDTFESTFAPMRWHIETPLESPDGLVKVVRANAHLEIAPRAHHAGHHFNGYTTDPLDLTNATIQIELVQAASNGAETIFAAAHDAENWYGFRLRGEQLYCEAHVHAVKRTHALPFRAYSHRHLRVMHDAALGVIAWQSSPDALHWTTLFSEAAQVPVTAMRAVLSAGTRTAVATPGKAIFDNFEYSEHE